MGYSAFNSFILSYGIFVIEEQCPELNPHYKK